MAERPRTLLVVAGTGTEVGKTFVGAELCRLLIARGLVVAARKPAQSGEPGDPTTDADELAAATGEDPMIVCPSHRRYSVAMAPPMAADATGGDRILLNELLAEVASSWPARSVDVGLIEQAGGVRSPHTHDADGVDVITAVSPDAVIVVADAGLGTINSIRLTTAAIRSGFAGLIIVVLNRFDPDNDLHVANRRWIEASDGPIGMVVTNIVELTDALIGRVIPRYCKGCGRRDSGCDGDCLPSLEPARHCGTCGRVVTVTVTPTGTSARCKVHGAVG